MTSDRIILFDGICNLCNSFVQFVIRHDPERKFRFGSLQSATGKALLEQFEPEQGRPDSVVLLAEGKVYRQSAAALKIFRELGGPWSLLYGFMVIPPFIRDAVYRLIAQNRYRMFGKSAECMIPSAELRDRFLE
jgi:predicted DCC family thiol-disulfide oxidoreductase YuxK